MTRRALITGITGQDGPFLARHLLSLGYDVVGMVRGQNNPWRPEVERLLPEARIIEADLLDGGSLIRMVAEAQPDEVYHLAAHRRASGGPNEMIGATTALGTERLLESVRITAGASASRIANDEPRVFCASSYEMFGNARRIVDEQSAPSPDTAIGIASAYAYETAGRYRRTYGMQVSRGIMFEHVSARCEAGAALRQIARDIIDVRRGRAAEAAVHLAGTCDVGMAADYVRAMHLALQQPAADDFIISSGALHTLGEFALAAWRLAAVGPGRIRDAGPTAGAGPIASSKKARIVLGWQPRATFDDVVATIVEAELKTPTATRATTRVPRRVTWLADDVDDDAMDVTNPLHDARAA